MLYFSAARMAFFDSAFHRALPADAVEITCEQHRVLLDGQAAGKTIAADRHGRPTLKDRSAPALADRVAHAQQLARAEARRRILAVASLEQQSNDNAAMALAGLQIANGGLPTLDPNVPLSRRLRIDAIRADCARLITDIAGMGARALAQLDVTADHHWPKE